MPSPAPPAAPGLRSVILAAVAVVALAVVVEVGWIIVAHPAWSDRELRIVAAVNAPWSPLLYAVAVSIDILFGEGGALVVASFVALFAGLGTRQWRVPVRIGLAAGGAWAIAELVKPVVRRVRPDPAALTRPFVPSGVSFSYPSGHTAFAVALGTAVVLTVFVHRWRGTAIAVTAVIGLVTAWSRVYLGVHYPTDTMASLVLVPLLVIALDTIVVALLARFAPARAG